MGGIERANGDSIFRGINSINGASSFRGVNDLGGFRGINGADTASGFRGINSSANTASGFRGINSSANTASGFRGFSGFDDDRMDRPDRMDFGDDRKSGEDRFGMDDTRVEAAGAKGIDDAARGPDMDAIDAALKSERDKLADAFSAMRENEPPGHSGQSGDQPTAVQSLVKKYLSTSRKAPGASFDRGVVRDGTTLGIVMTVRLVRVMVLWIAFYFVDRAYQSAYLQQTLVDGREPPPMWTIPFAAFAIEAFVYALVFLLLTLLYVRFKSVNNTFVIDGPLLARLAREYFATTAVSLAVCAGLGAVAQDRQYFRYKEDGLRGIRALSLMMLIVSAVTLNLFPWL